MLDAFVNQHELRQRGNVETRARAVQGADNGRLGVGFDHVVGLDLGQMLLESRIVFPDDIVIDHHDGRAVFASDVFELPGGHA